MRQDLCYDLISKLSSSPHLSSSLSSRFRAPGWVASDPLDTGGTTRFLHNSLFFGTEEQFSLWAEDTTNRIFFDALGFHSLHTRRDRRQRQGLCDVLRQFLHERSDRPVLAWVTPVWFLMTNPLPSRARLQDRGKVAGVFGSPRSTVGDVTLWPGRGGKLSLPLKPFTFFYPTKERGRNPQLIRLLRTRRATLHGKILFDTLREDGIVLARPGDSEDDSWLKQKKVPAEALLWTDEGRDKRVNMSTVTLAKLYPTPNRRGAVVAQVTFSISPDGLIIGIRASSRPFDIFLLHHQGAAQAIRSLL